MLNIRTVTLSVALVVILMLIVSLVTAKTEVASGSSSNPVSVGINDEQSASQNTAPIASYRSRLDECFDVPVGELASCHDTGKAVVPSFRSRLDVCFDVPLSELASCREESQVSNP